MAIDVEIIAESAGTAEPISGIEAFYPDPARAWASAWGRWKRRLWALALPLAAPVLLLALWQAAAAWSQSQLLPPPSQVWRTLTDMVRDGSLAANLGVSFRRVVLGWFWGAGLGLALGLALGFFSGLDEVLGPTLDAVNQVPIYAYLPLIVVFLGLGELGKVVFIAAGSFYPMLLNAREGARAVDPRHLELASVYGYSRLRAFWKVLLPEAAPLLLGGARTSLGLAWMLVVGAELFGASSGVGYLITWSRQLFQTDGVMVGILVVSVAGWALDRCLKALETRLLAWKKGHGNAWA